MKYIKLFETHNEYETYINGQDVLLPNVSYCEDNNEVHYNPYVPPQPIAPVGKVQVFANPQCTEYADGQSDTVWVRLNQGFGFGEETRWTGNSNQQLDIYTPTNQYPDDYYGVCNLWGQLCGFDQDVPFVSGQIIEMTYQEDAPEPFAPVDNPKVIFE
jgi:hypothetical protein